MATITGSISTGQIAKKVVSGGSETVTVGFESQRQKQLTVVVYNATVSGSAADISNLIIERVLQDGTTVSTESSHGTLAKGAGVTFAFSYNVPKFNVKYDSGGERTVFIEVNNGGIS